MSRRPTFHGDPLFPVDEPPAPSPSSARPLAERLRPRRLEDLVGQAAFATGAPVRLLLERGTPFSVILHGPPGSGKTSVARLFGQRLDAHFEPFSAVTAGVADVRRIVEQAGVRRSQGRATVLFVDEIHRFNKAQQDAFLPSLEDGTLHLVGATTENPSFHLTAALCSRCLVVRLEPLASADLSALGRRALLDDPVTRGLGLDLEPAAWERLAESSEGDARRFLGRLEALLSAAHQAGLRGRLSAADLERLGTGVFPRHSRGDHHDLASAYQKSLRASDPDGAVYWLGRLLNGGEDPLYVLRRLLVTASEDVGLADPSAVTRCVDALEAYRFLGWPEGAYPLVQATLYVASAPKSRTVAETWAKVQRELASGRRPPVPGHLRNPPSSDVGADSSCLPPALAARGFFDPCGGGFEERLRERRRSERNSGTGGETP